MNRERSATVIDIQVARTLRNPSPVSRVLKRVDISNILWTWSQLYFENIDPMYHEDTADLIRALMNVWSVTIYHPGSEISPLSVMSVMDCDGTIREMFMREFTALTRDDGEVSSRNLRESAWWLQQNNILARYIPNSVHHHIRDITDNELEWYKPDEIGIIQWSLKYTVIIMPESGEENIWSSFVIDFEHPEKCTLLDMMLCAFDDVVTYNWVPLKNYRIHIQSAEWSLQSLTLDFTSQQMEKVLYPRLKKSNELYTRLSYEESWKHYFRTQVIPKLKWK